MTDVDRDLVLQKCHMLYKDLCTKKLMDGEGLGPQGKYFLRLAPTDGLISFDRVRSRICHNG
jgi:hypothetical protein